MPSIVGGININSNAGTVNFGDNLNISPVINSKEITGQGSGNIGNVVYTANGTNLNNAVDPDLVDQPNAGNL
ncbi:MAG: spore germination protein [Bacillaceae bacterium]|nr:spore germination protein [Bacillaceae bacterium]